MKTKRKKTRRSSYGVESLEEERRLEWHRMSSEKKFEDLRQRITDVEQLIRHDLI